MITELEEVALKKARVHLELMNVWNNDRAGQRLRASWGNGGVHGQRREMLVIMTRPLHQLGEVLDGVIAHPNRPQFLGVVEVLEGVPAFHPVGGVLRIW